MIPARSLKKLLHNFTNAGIFSKRVTTMVFSLRTLMNIVRFLRSVHTALAAMRTLEFVQNPFIYSVSVATNALV